MAYPQSGQFPAYPQYPGQGGLPAKPPLPKTVQNAFYLMLSGAVLELASTAFALGSTSKLRDTIRKNNPTFTDTQVTNAVHFGVVAGVIGVLVGIGLWIWMAYANKAGKNWARITGTVFFGIDCLGLIGTLGSSSGSGAFASGRASGVSVVLSVVMWVVGLVTVILLWNKESSAYFKPPQFGGGPGYPYPYGVPGQQPMPPAGAQGQPQPPADPWSNPNPPQS